MLTDGAFVYGMPELNRAAIAKAKGASLRGRRRYAATYIGTNAISTSGQRLAV